MTDQLPLSEIVRRWLHGCGNTIPFHAEPWTCEECTSGMVSAMRRRLETEDEEELKATREAFLLGWLDAIWSGFGHGLEVGVPVDVKRQLMRRGLFAPTRSTDSNGKATASITPLGVRRVTEVNRRLGIKREGPAA